MDLLLYHANIFKDKDFSSLTKAGEWNLEKEWTEELKQAGENQATEVEEQMM